MSPCLISTGQWQRSEGYLEEIFAALGMPLHTPSTAGTPRRFLRALLDAASGYTS